MEKLFNVVSWFRESQFGETSGFYMEKLKEIQNLNQNNKEFLDGCIDQKNPNKGSCTICHGEETILYPSQFLSSEFFANGLVCEGCILYMYKFLSFPQNVPVIHYESLKTLSEQGVTNYILKLKVFVMYIAPRNVLWLRGTGFSNVKDSPL